MKFECSSVKGLGILTIAFILSIALRWNGISSYEGDHFWLNSHVLVTTQIWDETGFCTYNGNLVLSLPGTYNRHIGIPSFTNFFDEEGYLYYTSYPPLGLWLPYGIHRILRLSVSNTSIKIWNLLLHYLCVIILYATIKKHQSGDKLAIVLSLLYLFAPGPLYYQSQIYFSEMLAQLWWFLSLWGYTWSRTASKKKHHFIFWLVLSFVFVFTEWLGIFVIGTLGLILLFEKKSIGDLFPLVLGGGIAIIFTVWQYSQISGWEVLFEQWLLRYSYRSTNLISSQMFFKEVIVKYPLRMFALLPILGIGLVLFKKMSYQSLSRPQNIIYLSFFPYLLHTILFRNYSYVHDFSALKGGPFWIFLITWALPNISNSSAIRRLKETSKNKRKNLFKKYRTRSQYWILTHKKVLIIIFLTIWVMVGIQRFYFYSMVMLPDSGIGSSIKAQIPQKVPVFMNQVPSLPIIYAAQRNIGEGDSTAVQRWLDKTGHLEAVLVHIEDDSVQSMEYIYRAKPDCQWHER
ncbi:MAG: hypothetical protein AAF927_11200 [Bacteroidota bacterium]